ncbi:murein L,D-transpeptidase catalytic domain family protein [Flammeovirgaceae bacterium SG7u.111]|nr:murein L,D-transpeptidase catalytic domain family protein [Flammeovirgaceae bacterium SG7u.132]WPO35823.1 murein L,D-transpeptidase catalytic domain family protein [Flammeovirgaceae bacterium SG7u.111]
MKHLVLFALIALISTNIGLANKNNDGDEKTTSVESYIHQTYQHIDFGNRPINYDLFNKAMKGYLELKADGKLSSEKEIISIVDFTLSSTIKRLWIIDLKSQKVIFNTLVSHGKNTGEKYAENFSNTPSSLQSSVGFYVTGGMYQGKHGLSMFLDGQEKGFNDKARERYIVMHGANYVSEDYVKKHGRLGRSWGCPAVPMGIHNDIIKTIANKTCLFLFYPEKKYLISSKLINTQPELEFALGNK